VSQIVSSYVKAAGIAGGACHLFRHCAATGMLENGADLRAIQALLGHESVDATTVHGTKARALDAGGSGLHSRQSSWY